MKLIDKDALVAEIKELQSKLNLDSPFGVGGYTNLSTLLDRVDTLEVKEVDVSNISENIAEAYEYLDFTHTSNIAHNKPMIAARLRRAIKELYDARLFELTHDKKYRMENLGLKAQKGE